MSTRIELSGFDLTKMLALSGSRDHGAVDELEQQALNFYYDESMTHELKAVLRRAIEDGFPFADLDVESSVNISAARILADYRQKHLGTDSNFWNAQQLKNTSKVEAICPICGREFGPLMGSLPTTCPFDKVSLKPIDKPKQMFMDYFTKGRPLFGKQIDPDPSLYAYLSLDEINTALESLPAPGEYHLIEDPEINGADYVEIEETDDVWIALATWMTAIKEKELDLWMFLA